MDIDRIKKLLKQKEGIRLEFKEASTALLPKNLFETICAMLNGQGGDILLGVNDNGKVSGVNPDHIERLTKDLINLSNNPSKLDPPFILHPQKHEVDGKWILHIAIPESSEVHKCLHVVYDRKHEGDYKVTQLSQIVLLYHRKHNYYSEGRVFPGLNLSHFKTGLFTLVKNIIRGHTSDHPWLKLNREQLMRIAGLYSYDPLTKTEGYNLAAVLLFGTDQTILNLVPYFKIDALVRRDDLDRYDDRLYIQTNLIEAYSQLMSFVEKHLPDKFFIRGDQRISLRGHIFREIAANLIIHREYRDASPSTFIIYKDRVEVKNANNPRSNGLMSPNNFTPCSKNPILARFFIQLGRVDQLGSGILNVYKFLRHYSPGREAQFIEDKMFTTIIPVGRALNDKNDIKNEDLNAAGDANTPNRAINRAINRATNRAISEGIMQRIVRELIMIQECNGISLDIIMSTFNIKRTVAQSDIKILKDAELVAFHGSNKTGKYVLTEKGKQVFLT